MSDRPVTTGALRPGTCIESSSCVSVVRGPWTVLDVLPTRNARERQIVVLDVDGARRNFRVRLRSQFILSVPPTP